MPEIQTTVGAERAIAKTYGVAISISAISNAAEAVVTLPNGHTVTVGKYVEVKSNWGDLDGRIIRVKDVDAASATLEGFDTSDIEAFEAGTGIGSLRVITAWDKFANVKDVKASGGDRQWLKQTVDGEKAERAIPSITNATIVALEVYDDRSMAWFQTALAASKKGIPAAYRIKLATGAITVVNTYWAVNETPDHSKNVEVTSKMDLAYLTTPTRYAV